MNEKAVSAFIENKELCIEMLKEITEHMENHMDTAPTDIDWSHVGSASHVASELNNIREFLGL